MKQINTGKRRMSRLIKNLLQPCISDHTLDDGYKALAADKEREKEASEWCNGLAEDTNIETR